MPVLNDVGIRTVINGPIPVSADGEPVMGIAEGIDNFFIACGFTAGIAASGGAGLAMANWIANGDPGMDLWPFDLRRFGKLHNGLAYLRDAAIEAYARYYVIAWPEEEREACRPLRRSPLHAMLAANGAVHGQKFGFERPNYFLTNGKAPSIETFERAALAPVVSREHKAIREGVALIDMSSFSKFEITGPGALRYLQWLAAGNIDKGEGARRLHAASQREGRHRGRPHHHAADRRHVLCRDRLGLRHARRRLDQEAHAARRLGVVPGCEQRLRRDQSVRPARARRARRSPAKTMCPTRRSPT